MNKVYIKRPELNPQVFLFDNKTNKCLNVSHFNLLKLYEMATTHLKFSKKGDEAIIVFPGGKKSIEYGSKEEVHEALVNLFAEHKITEEELTAMKLALMEAKNLPWGDSGNMFGFGGIISVRVSTSKPRNLEDDYRAENPVSVRFEMHEDHAHITATTEGWTTGALYSKHDARECVRLLGERNEILADLVEPLTEEVNNSSLPEGEPKQKDSGSGFPFGLSFLASLFGFLDDMKDGGWRSPEIKVKTCRCGEHRMITHPEIHVPPFETQSVGNCFIDALLEGDRINQETADRLRTEVAESGLPVGEPVNVRETETAAANN